MILIYSFSTDFSQTVLVQKPIDAHTILVELKMPQLTLVKIAQMGRHETVNTKSENYGPRVEGLIPVRDNFLLKIILL